MTVLVLAIVYFKRSCFSLYQSQLGYRDDEV